MGGIRRPDKTDCMKPLLTFLLVLTLAGQAAAQAPLPAGDGPKECIVIDYFAWARDVPPAYAEALRSRVIASFVARGREKVVDATTLRAWAPDGEIVAHPDAILNPQRETAQNRAEAIRSLGARYILSGTVTAYRFTHETTPDKKSRFRTQFVFTLSCLDLLTGESSAPEEFKADGRGEKADLADRNALESIPGQMIYYIDRNFKFSTAILQLGEPNAKGKLKELYVGCGSSIGVQRGDLFKVYLTTRIGDSPVQTQIGKLRAKEVCGEQVTLCAIASGAEAIAEAFTRGDRLTVISDSQALF